MVRAEDTNEFYWDTFFVKVENKLFCVPRHAFIQSSEVFADMFLSHSGQDRDHPIVLEGFKKDEFTCLLKVMYPTFDKVRSLLIPGNLELDLTTEEWMSVLKLSTIWNMTEIRQYAILWLSTNVTLSPIEKILLARAHRVGVWLDEAVTSLATCNPMPKLEDLATLGWETVARILWIRDSLSSNAPNAQNNTLCFRRDAIKCADCPARGFPLSSSPVQFPSDQIEDGYCKCKFSSESELTYSGSARTISGSHEPLVTLGQIQCSICRENPFRTAYVDCYFCGSLIRGSSSVRVDTHVTLYKSIEEMFGEEIEDYEKMPEYSPRSPGPNSDNPA